MRQTSTEAVLNVAPIVGNRYQRVRCGLPVLETIAVVGAAQAGGYVATTVRRQGFTGRVILIGDERHPPYERPPLSKDVLLGKKPPSTTYLWTVDSLRALNVDLRLGVRAIHLDVPQRQLSLSNGDIITYDKLAITTGSRPRRLEIPGSDLAGVYYLRTLEDSLGIREELRPDSHVLVVGGGWIGLEVAAAARQLGARVTLVEAGDRLCSRVLPESLADFLLRYHQSHGVDVRLGTTVNALGGGSHVESAQLSNGEVHKISAVIVGVGVVPNIELAVDAGLKCDNGIMVDEYGRTSDPHVYAAGDVTNHPNALVNRRLRLEAWANAQNQAIAVGKSMVGGSEPYRDLPWFWSDQYDLNLQLLGLPLHWNPRVLRGDPSQGRFIEFFLVDNQLECVAAVNSARDVRPLRQLLQSGQVLDTARLADPAVNVKDLCSPAS